MKASFLFIILGLTFFGCQQPLQVRQVHTSETESIFPKIVQAVQDHHIVSRKINDELSKDMFDYFIEKLDVQKEFLTQKDISILSQYELTIDDAIQDKNFDFLNTAITLLENGIKKAENYSDQLLTDLSDFTTKEHLEINFSKLPFASNDKALKNRWRKKLKKYLLDQMHIEKLNKPSLSNEQLLAKAKEKVQKLLTQKFDKLKAVKDRQYNEAYVNAFLKVHDFQTQYFSNEEKLEWEESFNRSFVGIGVRLETENAYPKVTETIIGGPAWKNNLLEANDEILRIKEKNTASIDLMGKSIEEIISLIKGAQGTTIYLTIKDKDANIKKVEIKREKIEFDQAMSFLLEDKHSEQKIGYIRLPRFYVGDEGSAAHILSELEILKANEVEGIIFDVRNNHGGSARECRSIIDYFLEDGICMQTKRVDGEANQIFNEDPSVQYEGKLLVLTNSKSGSASELFAGTMQDYKRALIVGGESTFGKGSIQNFIDIVESEDSGQKSGEIKMSVGLFYTASGRSPQLTGIVPDIKLTDDYKYIPSGESAQRFAMPNDALPKTAVSQAIYVVDNINQLISKSKNRTKNNEKFQLADEKAKALLSKEETHLIALDKASYKAQIEAKKNTEKKWNKINAEIENLKVSFDKRPFAKDSISVAHRQRWIKQIKNDPYIYECYQIINDMTG